MFRLRDFSSCCASTNAGKQRTLPRHDSSLSTGILLEPYTGSECRGLDGPSSCSLRASPPQLYQYKAAKVVSTYNRGFWSAFWLTHGFCDIQCDLKSYKKYFYYFYRVLLPTIRPLNTIALEMKYAGINPAREAKIELGGAYSRKCVRTEELTTDLIKQDNSEIYHLSDSTTESDINMSSKNISELLGRHATREKNQTRFYKDVNQPHKDLQVTSKLKNTYLELEKVPWNFNADYQQSLQVLEQISDWDYSPHPLYHPYQLKPPEPSNRPFILNPTDESPYPPNRSPLNKLSALPPTPTLIQTKHPKRSFPHSNPPKITYPYLPYNMMMTNNKFKPPNQMYPTNLYKPRRLPALKHPWDTPPSVPYPPIKRDILSPPFSPTALYHDSSLNTDGILYLPEYPYPFDPNDVNIPDRTRNSGFHGTIPKPCQVYPQPILVFLPNPVLPQIFPFPPYTLSLFMAKPAPPTPPPLTTPTTSATHTTPTNPNKSQYPIKPFLYIQAR
uniref:Uncharacterized protein n=1 Tax=Timema bartmani TaxID=61472 RepID=A0A7R9F991_9NEOP|nr:unnamed protein product [Timema bartmani]